MQEDRCRLYLITPPRIEPAAFAEALAAALDAGDVAALQLRLKDCGRDEILRAAEVLAPVARARDVAFIMNDDPALAAETGCDGVHVGQRVLGQSTGTSRLVSKASMGRVGVINRSYLVWNTAMRSLTAIRSFMAPR